MPTTLGQCWREGARLLLAGGNQGADRDAQLLLLEHLKFVSIDLIAKENLELSVKTVAEYQVLLARRLAGEPVARIVGSQEFYGLIFELNANTLVPRPETELLVDLGLDFLSGEDAPQILDLGTGSGAILVSLLVNSPMAHGVAIELSENALECAKTNALRHNVFSRAQFLAGSWFSPLAQLKAQNHGQCARFDLVVSNPPYIRPDVIETLEVDVREHDPVLALDGGADGLDAYRAILLEVEQYLAPNGCVMFEIGHDQGQSVSALCDASGFGEIHVHQDIAGLNRVVIAK